MQIAMRIKEACEAARVGRTCLNEAIKSGALPARKRGKAVLILVNDLQQWLESLPSVVPAAKNKTKSATK